MVVCFLNVEKTDLVFPVVEQRTSDLPAETPVFAWL